jgi:hypothetical protein
VGRKVRETLRSLEEVKLLALLHKAPGRNALIDFRLEALRLPRGRIAIGEPERRTGYSRRYLDRPFDRHVGVSPKVLAGIFAFKRSTENGRYGCHMKL